MSRESLDIAWGVSHYLFELQNEITRRFFVVSSHYHYLNNPSFKNIFFFFRFPRPRSADLRLS